MSDQNAVQREATKDFYIKWLTEHSPSLLSSGA